MKRARGTIARQAAVFSMANSLATALGGVTTAILARELSSSDFGRFSFAISLLLFLALLFEFGLFLPAARLIARSDLPEQRAVIGAALLTYLPVGFAFSLTVYASSFVVDPIFNLGEASILRDVAPLAFGIPFALVAMLLAQAGGRLHVFSLGTLAMQLMFLATILVVGAFGVESVRLAVLLRAASGLAAAGAMAWWLRPIFVDVRRWMSSLADGAKSFGFSVYVGRVFSTGTYNMDTLMLGAWTDARTVGYYSIATSVAAASGLPVQGLASALFPRMANHGLIERRWLVVAWAVGGACALVAILGAGLFVRVVLSPRYAPAVALVLPLALGQAIRGTTGVYNWFLAAHGHGKALRRAATVLTVSNLVLNFALIPRYGADGAAWASAIALVANLAAHMTAYRSATQLGPPALGAVAR